MNAPLSDAQTFNVQPSDPRLVEYLKEYPPPVFSERLYQSIGTIGTLQRRDGYRSGAPVEGDRSHQRNGDRSMSCVVSFPFSPLSSSLCIGSWNVWSKSIASKLGPMGTLAYTICGTRRGHPISKTCVQRVCRSILRTRRLLDLLDHAASLYPAVANGEQSGDRNLLGPQGVPLWLNYFHNDNSTYAVNNWVGAALAAERVSSQRALRILEVGAGPGSASEILLRLFDERGLLPRVERYLITEPNAFFLRCGQRKLARQYPDLPPRMGRAQSRFALEHSRHQPG